MDILIKNMEMPSCCEKCFFVKKCSAHAVQLKKMSESEHEQIFDVFGEMRLKGCPLIPVPEHGDLIDRDKEIKEWALTKSFLSECEQKQTFDYRKACIVISALSQAEVVLERTT